MTYAHDEWISGSSSGKGEEGHVPTEVPNNLISVANARVVDLLCEGPIRGLANGPSSILLNGIPLKSPGATDFNFKGVKWQFNAGDPDQTAFKHMPSVESSYSVSQEVTKAVSLLRTVSDTDIDDISVTVMVPSLYVIQEEDGDMVGTRVELLLQIRPNGGAWQTAAEIVLSGKTNTTYQRDVLVEDVSSYGAGPWDLRLSRVTDDHSQSNISDKTYWTSYATLINERFIMPHSAACYLRLNAKQFGTSIPERSYEIYGLDHVRIPSNMNSQSNYTSTIWDGTWQYGWSDDPVWLLMEMLTNPKHGRGLPLSCIDKWKFYEVSRWCHQLVDDGTGGKRKRFRFNGILQSQEKAYELFNAIASCFWGTPIWSSGLVTLVADMPKKASHIATPSNVDDGLFTYSGSGINARPSVAYVTWNDPDDHYRPAVAVHTDRELLNQYGWNKIDVVAPGCTDRHQAICHGRWLIETVKAEKDVVTFKGGAYWADCGVGCVVAVQDPWYSNVDWGGRCASGSTTTSIVLDRAVTLASGVTYTLQFDLPNGSKIEKTVTSAAGTRTTLSIQTISPANPPVAGAQWILSSTSLTPKLYRVVSHVEVEKGKYEITAAYHDPTKFGRIFNGSRLRDSAHSGFPTGAIPAVSDLDVTQFTFKSGRNYLRGVQLSWEHIDDDRVTWYQVQWRKGDGDWKRFDNTEDCSSERRRVAAGTYDFRVRGRGVGVGPWYEVLGVSITDPSSAPPDVQNLHVLGGTTAFVGKDCELVWDSVIGTPGCPTGKFSSYEVKIYSTSDVLLRTEFVTDERYVYTLEKNRKDTAGSPARSMKFRIRVVDVYGVKSVNAATLTAANPAPSMAGFTPSLSTYKGGFVVDWSLWAEEQDMLRYRVYLGKTNPPTAGRGFVASPHDMRYVSLNVIQADTYYAQVEPYDVFGVGTKSSVASIAAEGIRVLLGGDLLREDGTTVVTDRDLFLDGLCARTITLTTGGKFQSAASGTRFEITKDYIRGLNASNVEQVKISASTGKLTAGADEVVIDSAGIALLSPYSTSVADRNLVKWNDSGGYRVASIWADIGLPDGGGPRLNLTTEASINPSIITLDAKGSTGRVYLQINSTTVLSAHPTTGLTVGNTGYPTYLDGSSILIRRAIAADTTDDNSAISIYGGGSASNGAGIVANGRSHSTYPGRLQLRFGGYDSTGDIRFTHLDTAGSANIKAVIDSSANFQLGGNPTINGGNNTIHIKNGTAPGSITDYAQVYAADMSAGACAIHVLSEDGKTIKLYPMAAIADASGDPSNVVAQFNTLLARLRNRGYLAS